MFKLETELASTDRQYLDVLRGASILRVVLVHLGLGWFFMPYSTAISLLFPVLFFVSGAVSYFSFLRSSNTLKYLLRRLALIAIPYALLAFFVLVWIYVFNLDAKYGAPNIKSFFIMLPSVKQYGINLAQLWYLQCLVVLTIITLPFFMLSKKSITPLVLLTGTSLIIGLSNEILNLRLFSLFNIHGVDIFMALTNALFFGLGAIYYRVKSLFSFRLLLSLAACFMLIFWFLIFNETNLNFNNLKDNMDSTYVIGALCILLGLLPLKNLILTLESNKFGSAIINFLVFCSTQSFSIYLLHTIVLAFIEYTLFPDPLTNNLPLALLRMVLVIALTLILSPIYTWLTKLLTRPIGNLLK